MPKANDPIRELNRMIKIHQKHLDRLRHLDEEVQVGIETNRSISAACKCVFDAKMALLDALGHLERERLDELLRKYETGAAESRA